MKRQAAKPQSIETIVNRIVREVKFGKKDPTILDQLCCLSEYINMQNYSNKEIAESFPFGADKTYQELKQIRKKVYDILYDEIKNSDFSMLTTYRICTALWNLYPRRRIPMKNPKVKICDTLWGFDTTGNFDTAFKMMTLMDEINQK